jgi:hypothetical protein
MEDIQKHGLFDIDCSDILCRILPVLFRIGFPATVVIAFVLMVLISLHISSIYYTTVQVAPELTVTVMPEFTVIGPILISL